MNSEKTTNSEETMNSEETIEGEETALETEPEPRQHDSRLLWIIGGLVAAALALLVGGRRLLRRPWDGHRYPGGAGAHETVACGCD